MKGDFTRGPSSTLTNLDGEVRNWMLEGVDAALTLNPGTTAGTLRVVKDGPVW